jgi:NAD(P)H-hydrate repair Nnr-like enzyme with NAD(P)H-hydrate epimerase domain
VTPESGELLGKARDCLAQARIIVAAGVGEDAGDAHLAGFHAAQAVIYAHREDRQDPPGRSSSAVADRARGELQLAELALFCPEPIA